MRRAALGAAVVAALALLAGCSAIPVSGPVNTPAPQNAAPAGVPVLTPAGPSAGASPADIVRGFLVAGSGQQDDYAIARQYLTGGFAKTWRPGAGVLVYQTSPAVTSTGATASVTPVATLDAGGYLTQPTSPGVQTLQFTFQKVAGEWRIASAPNGIVLPQSVFQRLFRTVALDYFTPDFAELVPDTRWFPASGDATSDTVRRQLAALVVRRLIAGAAAPIAAPVTATGFPSGTGLRDVAVAGPSATVDLHLASAPGSAAQQRMHQQLASSLFGLGVTRVELELDGVVQPDQTGSPLSPSASAEDGPLVLHDGDFGYLADGRVTSDSVLGAAIVKAGPRSGSATTKAVVASKALQRAAVLTRSGPVVLVAPKGRPTTIDDRAGLIGPGLDPDGWVWSVPARDPLGLVAVQGSKRVSVPISTDASAVTAIEVSRDGTRLLVVLDGATDPRVVVAGIERDAQGVPTGLSDAVYEAPVTAQQVIDATWADGDTAAMLVRRSDGTEGVVLQQLGGFSVPDGVLSQASAIVGGAKQADLAVLAGKDVQQTAQGNTIWQSIGTGIDLLAVQR